MTEIAPPKQFDPLSIWYIRVMRMILRLISGWPSKALGETETFYIKVMNIYLPIQTFILTGGEIYYLYLYNSTMSFLLQGQCYINTALSIMTFIRGCIVLRSPKYGQIMKHFLMSFHLIHHKDKGEYYGKMYLEAERYSMYAAVYYWGLLVFGSITFSMQSMYMNYRRGFFKDTLEEKDPPLLAIYYAFPGYDPVENFWISTFINLDIILVFCNCFCNLDLLCLFMAFQIICHFRILQNSLKNIAKPKKQEVVEVNGGYAVVEAFEDEENVNVAKILAGCVEHHKLIISFTDEMSDYFGLMFGLNYGVTLVSGCLLLLELSMGGMDALAQFGALSTGMLVQLIVTSVLYEILVTESENLIDIVYDIPWECMDRRNQRTMCILLQRVQSPVTVTAMGLAPVGVTTMASVMKTTFSYFMFLRTLDA